MEKWHQGNALNQSNSSQLEHLETLWSKECRFSCKACETPKEFKSRQNFGNMYSSSPLISAILLCPSSINNLQASRNASYPSISTKECGRGSSVLPYKTKGKS